MCLLCFKHDDYSIDHLESEVRKLKKEELGTKARAIKTAIKNYEIWLKSDHLDGFERAAIEQSLENLKKVQYLISHEI